MVGGGIFAVLGIAVVLTQGGAPLAFAFGGVVALLTAYSYSRLSVTYPSEGGTVIFIDKAFGVDILTGTLNNLLWISYVVMLALYAYAFGNYGATFFPNHPPIVTHILISAAIIVPTAVNLLGAGIIGKSETAVVGVKLTILLLFVIVGVPRIQLPRIAPATWTSPVQMVAGAMIIFLAYEGFELMANAAKDVRDYRRTLPRAFYTAVIFVALLYVSVAAVTVGTLSLQKVAAARDFALAEAAKPVMGHPGFVLIAVAAMLSTFSAINATLYGSARLSYTIAKEGELPEFLEKKVWNSPAEGLFITSALALLLANLGDLSSISTMGSSGFLLIFAAVNAAGLVKAKETGANRLVSLVGVVLCVLALAVLVWQTAKSAPRRLWVIGLMIGLALLIETAYQLFLKEEHKVTRVNY